MKDVVFPRSWLLNLNTIESLAERLNLSMEYLRNLEKRIPSCYCVKNIKIKNKIRTLTIPDRELKIIQRNILSSILKFKFPNYVHGGVSGRSIISNAETHLSKKWVMCLDIKNFFPSVHFKKIYNNFVFLNCSQNVSSMLTHLTTYNYQLPQGAPTSPIIANMVLYDLDKRFFNLCMLNGFKYSRYFDDIAISGKKNPEIILGKCESIIKSEGFTINKKPEKLRIRHSSEEQIVTGLLVNGKNLQMPKEKITEIKNTLQKMESGDFSNFIDKDPIKIKSVMGGHIVFLKSVNLSIARELEKCFNNIKWEQFC